jgi:hypothetical protein
MTVPSRARYIRRYIRYVRYMRYMRYVWYVRYLYSSSVHTSANMARVIADATVYTQSASSCKMWATEQHRQHLLFSPKEKNCSGVSWGGRGAQVTWTALPNYWWLNFRSKNPARSRMEKNAEAPSLRISLLRNSISLRSTFKLSTYTVSVTRHSERKENPYTVCLDTTRRYSAGRRSVWVPLMHFCLPIS